MEAGTMQEQRTQRAREEIASGALTAARIDPNRYLVLSGSGNTYIVAREDERWTCTCPDFAARGSTVRCKHIEAVRMLLEQEQEGDAFPMEEKMEQSFAQILRALAEPFPASAIQWKPTAVAARSDGSKAAMALAYVDARLYQERLDQVCPDWTSKVEVLSPDGSLVKVSLTIAGVTREELGEADEEDDGGGRGKTNTATTAMAQAFKRACTAFGLGRYLYFLPAQWVPYDGHKFLQSPRLPAWALPESERPQPKQPAQAPAPKQEAPAVPQEEPEELEEEEEGEAPAESAGDYRITFGKRAGKFLRELSVEDVRWYAHEMSSQTQAAQQLRHAAQAWLAELGEAEQAA